MCVGNLRVAFGWMVAASKKKKCAIATALNAGDVRVIRAHTHHTHYTPFISVCEKLFNTTLLMVAGVYERASAVRDWYAMRARN